jgi:hypothetical protein
MITALHKHFNNFLAKLQKAGDDGKIDLQLISIL